jgi:hypothetical protein
VQKQVVDCVNGHQLSPHLCSPFLAILLLIELRPPLASRKFISMLVLRLSVMEPPKILSAPTRLSEIVRTRTSVCQVPNFGCK